MTRPEIAAAHAELERQADDCPTWCKARAISDTLMELRGAFDLAALVDAVLMARGDQMIECTHCGCLNPHSSILNQQAKDKPDPTA